MAYDPAAAQRVQLGTCSVTFGETDLGLTKGGVEVAITTDTYKIQVDQFGNTEINEYILGRTLTVTVPMAETDITKLQLVIPNSVIVTDATDPTKKKLTVPSSVGFSLLDVADKLVCHPVAKLATDKSDDFVVPLAAPKGEFTFAYKLDSERIYSIQFTGYPDLTTGLLFIMGDEAAVAA